MQKTPRFSFLAFVDNSSAVTYRAHLELGLGLFFQLFFVEFRVGCFKVKLALDAWGRHDRAVGVLRAVVAVPTLLPTLLCALRASATAVPLPAAAVPALVAALVLLVRRARWGVSVFSPWAPWGLLSAMVTALVLVLALHVEVHRSHIADQQQQTRRGKQQCGASSMVSGRHPAKPPQSEQRAAFCGHS